MASKRIAGGIGCAAALATIVLGASVHADPVADFYKDKTISIISGGGAGGAYGIYAMLLSEYLGRHIPGQPTVIVKYMQGVGGVRAANYLYSVAPKDGATLGAPLQNMPTLQLLGTAAVRYDARKFAWLGRAVDVTSIFVVKPTAATSLDELRQSGREVIVGIAAVGAPNHILPALTSYGLGVRLKLVSGYEGSNGIALAYERGEVDGLALPWASLRLSQPHFLKDTLVVQSGFEKHPDYPTVPLLLDVVTDPHRKAIVELFQVQEAVGRSYIAPPDTPSERVQALRRAFDATIGDPAFIAAAKKRQADINARPGEEMQRLVERHIGTDSAIVATAKQAVGIK